MKQSTWILGGAVTGFLVVLAKSLMGSVYVGGIGSLIGAAAGASIGWLLVVSREWRSQSEARARLAYWIMGCAFAGPFILLAGPLGEEELSDPVFWLMMLGGTIVVGGLTSIVIRFCVEALGLE